LVNVTKHSG